MSAPPVPQQPTSVAEAVLGSQPHARAVLAGAFAAGAQASHAYLFHGPAGTGKAAVARELAAALLQDGAASPGSVRERVLRESHPDLTWVRPSGAAEMLVGDVEEPVVAAASRTPFESRRRVFVIESAQTLNDQAANRLLKTLEEPAAHVHLLLLTERLEDVMPTIRSRCLLVRFDPLGAGQIAAGLDAASPEQALACARLSLGDAGLAAELCAPAGVELRAAAEGYVRGALAGETGARPWAALLEGARSAGVRAGEQGRGRLEQELELLPTKERRRHEREAQEAAKRGERRARTRTLDIGLRLAELWLRDLLSLRVGAGELIHAVDREAELREDAAAAEGLNLEQALALFGAARRSLASNVAEELALEALAYRLGALRTG